MVLCDALFAFHLHSVEPDGLLLLNHGAKRRTIVRDGAADIGEALVLDAHLGHMGEGLHQICGV